MATVYARVGLDRFSQDLAQIIHKDSVMKGVEKAGNVGLIHSNTILDE